MLKNALKFVLIAVVILIVIGFLANHGLLGQPMP